MTKMIAERVHFRLVQTECCTTLLCCVNPRLYNFCPECGKHIYPAIRSWVVNADENAELRMKL